MLVKGIMPVCEWTKADIRRSEKATLRNFHLRFIIYGFCPIQICISINVNLNKRYNYLQPVLSLVYCKSAIVKNTLSAVSMEQVERRKLVEAFEVTNNIFPIVIQLVSLRTPKCILFCPGCEHIIQRIWFCIICLTFSQ